MQTDFAHEIEVLALSNTRKNYHNYQEWEKTTEKERKWIKAEWNHIWTQKNAFDYLNNQLNPMCNLNLIIHHVSVCSVCVSALYVFECVVCMCVWVDDKQSRRQIAFDKNRKNNKPWKLRKNMLNMYAVCPGRTLSQVTMSTNKPLSLTLLRVFPLTQIHPYTHLCPFKSVIFQSNMQLRSLCNTRCCMALQCIWSIYIKFCARVRVASH